MNTQTKDVKAFTFKTNINCSGCVAQVTPFLNETGGIQKWQVNTTDPNKILTVESGSLSAEEIMTAVKKGGFKIESITI